MNSINDQENALEPAWADLPEGNAAGVFGKDDVLGTLNRQTPKSVLSAASTVKEGRVFPLNLSLSEPDPPLFNRKIADHHPFTTPRGNMDDYLDNFYPQSASHWDGFLHVPDKQVGFYNGHGVGVHGMHHWAEKGIVGRGVVLDLSEAILKQGGQDAYFESTAYTLEDLIEAQKKANVAFKRGDILMLRTGWISWYRGLSLQEKNEVKESRKAPGLLAAPEVFEFLWNNGFVALVSDSPGVETLPSVSEGSIHQKVLSRLGMPLGELWWLDDLYEHCKEQNNFECMVTSSPLNLVGGVGSPANALAIK